MTVKKPLKGIGKAWVDGVNKGIAGYYIDGQELDRIARRVHRRMLPWWRRWWRK